MSNVFENIIQELILLTDPVRGASNDEDSLQQFFKPMGWNFEDNSGMPLANIVNAIGQISQTIQTCQELIESEDAESLEKVFQLLSALKSLFESVSNLVNSFDGANLDASQIEEVTTDVLHYLTTTYLIKKSPTLWQLLFFIEVIQIKKGEETQFNNAGKIIRYPYQFSVLNFDNLGKFIQNPVAHFNSIYITPFDRNTISGAKDFTDKLFPRIGNIASSLGAMSVYGIKPSYGIDFGAIGNEMASGALTIKMQTPLDEIKVGATVLYSSRDRGDLGWVIVPFGEVKLDQIIDKYYFSINSVLNVGGIIIGNDGNVSFDTSNGLSSVFIDILARKLAEDDTGVAYLIGEKGGTRLEIGSLGIGSKLGFSTEKVEFDVHFDLSDAKFVISGGGQDSFISKLIPSEGMEIPFDFLLGYSSVKGLYFNASAGLELALPVHISLLDILRIESIYLKIKVQDSGIKAETSITGGASLGPLNVSFEEIGLQSKLDWTKKEKNIGFADFSLEFKPPNGLGLSLDAGVVKGGGYLYFNFDREEYAGALELVFSEWIALKAIGVITTKMPDGSKGFSMVIVITAEFGSGLQLGFGFTLLGVGGIVGINRVVNVEPLKVGVRTGAIESVMFPQNVVANAPRIISDLKAFFPVREGQFLIGPMAKIGFGTPTLASLSLGVIIEFPDVNITILGVLKVVLPDENADVLRLQVNFLGRIEPANNLLWFYAELYDSRVLFITLEGGMGLLVNWGDNANFVFSVGGFHPQYTPPPLPFPAPPRLAVSILNESYARVRIEGYFAVTSNSVQFGARVEVFFGLSAFNIDGYFGFDALFQFDPFYFSFSLSVSLSVKLFGMGLFSVGFSGLLEGPTPWHIKGHGSIGFLFFSVSVPFEVTWGQQPATPLPPIEILPLIEREFNAITNWQAITPKGSNLFVSLRKLDEPATSAPQTSKERDQRPLVLHPVGSLRISQRKMPLDFKMDKLGNQKPDDVNEINIETAIGGANAINPVIVKEKFARGEYQNLDQAKKLSEPGFELYTGGLELKADGAQLQTSMAVKRIIRYETIIIDSNYKRHSYRFFETMVASFYLLASRLFGHFVKGSVITKSTLSAAYQQRIQPNEQLIRVELPKYAVALTMNNSPIIGADGTAIATFGSKAEAFNFMQSQIAGDPSRAGALHIIPSVELNTIAA